MISLLYQTLVAMSLYNRGVARVRAQRFEEAIKALRRCVELSRQLSQRHPRFFLPKVALSLTDLGTALHGRGFFEKKQECLEEAIAVYKEALELWQSLQERQSGGYEAEIARTLNNLGAVFKDLDRFAESVAVLEESLKLWRRIAALQPEVYTPHLAAALANLGDSLRALGRSDPLRLREAALVYQEAIELWQRLAERQPKQYESDLSATLARLEEVQKEIGRLE